MMELRHLIKHAINRVMIGPAAKEGEDVVAPIGDAKTEQVGALPADQYPAYSRSHAKVTDIHHP